MPLLSKVLSLNSERHTGNQISPKQSHPRSNSTISEPNPQNFTTGSKPSTKFSLSINLESPPIVLYGLPTESSGSIISGILTLTIKPVVSSSRSSFEEVELNSVTLSLVQTMKYTSPFTIPNSELSICSKCRLRAHELARWDILKSKASFPMGEHSYPFSHLFPGSIPATSKLGSANSQSYIKYELIAIAKTPNKGEQVKLVLPITVSRSVLRGPDRNSLRIFPPTETTASVVLPNVVYPKSTFPIELKLDNLVSGSKQRRWRMRRLTWRIEEHTRVKAYACEEHQSHLTKLEKQYRGEKKKKPRSTQTKPNVVRTDINLMHSPSSAHYHEQISTNPTEIDIPVEEEDEPVSSGPSQAHQSFIEDFITRPTSDESSNDQTQDNSTYTPPPGPPQSSDSDKHIYLEERRIVSYGELKSGWKSDFSARGKVELIGHVSASGLSRGLNNPINKITSEDPIPQSEPTEDATIACDIDDPTLGVHVEHTLVAEAIVAEEIIHNIERTRKGSISSRTASYNKPPPSADSGSSSGTSGQQQQQAQGQSQMGVPTGAARVLRMQFKLQITERSGLGIAWDDEVPPTYEDVRTFSPPIYAKASPGIAPVSSGSRVRASVLDGIGNTPIVGRRGRSDTGTSIDEMNDLQENIQDLTL
ncbi:LDB19 [[Candida] subhashii]|uniref:LDB19 n=1 Tax=[Candida] subhashii TaxID=561895 RepID=A0A8J5UWY2_9ASCO|nr:LDB19 [[Candida] subhashii]KAG7662014.1 LDB19 [[Candida] subhashii]